MTSTRMAAAVVLAAAIVIARDGNVPLRAERLPLRHFTTVDGLVGDFVINIDRDRRGFLWFSTRDGVSRFDGAHFRSYGLADGLPRATVNAVLETRDGRHWLATNGGGICLFQPDGATRFVAYPIGASEATNRVNVLHEDAAGRLWAGTDAGVFVRAAGAEDGNFRPVDLALPDDINRHGVTDIAEDTVGSVWIGGGFGLRRHLPDGRLVRYRVDPDSPRDRVTSVLALPNGEVWTGFRSGLLRLTAGFVNHVPADVRTSELAIGAPTRPRVDGQRWFLTGDGLPGDMVTALHESADGQFWVGTTGGIAQLVDGQFRAYRAASGLPDAQVSGLADDEAGNLWIATLAGVSRLVRGGLRTYTEADGLADARIHSITEDPDGRLVVISGDFNVNRFDGRRFESVRPMVAAGATCNWMSRCAQIDRSGGLWALTTAGLEFWRSTRPRDLRSLPSARYGLGRGLPADDVFAAFADSQGRIWIGETLGGVSVWHPPAQRWDTLSDEHGLPRRGALAARANVFAEDRDGHIWAGFEGAGLARERNGRFTTLLGNTTGDLNITTLYVDAAARLWVATSQSGVGVIADTADDVPEVQWFTIDTGLASNNVRTLVEDSQGRIYAGTSRGVDRLLPDTGEVRHFTISEGLGSQFVTSSFRDRHGTLWFGTVSGLSRLDVTPLAAEAGPSPAPQVFISGLRASGVPQPLSALGEVAPASFDLAASNNHVDVEFFAHNYEGGAPLRYQHRLGTGDAGWSQPSESRTVTYAFLSPGHYTLAVRAVRPDGVVSEAPAVVAFTIRPPFYATWWFLLMSALVVAGLVVTGYRIRVARLVGVERVRARIATDLHDDIGASLSQIAILAEVARARAGQPPERPGAPDPLDRIAETSRTLVDAMSDIVWAINPEVDTLDDLVHRMRRFIEDTLGSADVEVAFAAPDPAHTLRLGADVRREVFLILKESVNNIAKHAHCRTATIALTVDRRRLVLEVADDGRGFDLDARTDGNGVASMRRRVGALGGRLSVNTAPGRGTRIRLELHL